MTAAPPACPICAAPEPTVFYEVDDVPVHDVLLMRTRAAALAFPTGNIRLAFCATCGFVWNRAFDPTRLRYSAEYEETQAFSPTFNAFHRRLAAHLIDRYALRGRHIVEIGCGKGEFLTLLCELGSNTGTGYDPSYVPARTPDAARGRVTFIADRYSEAQSAGDAALICCKMTLEHVPDPRAFVAMVHRSMHPHAGTVVFFQVPNLTRILRDVAFWDVYYEHCSYFGRVSLAGVFRRCGFEILDLREDYDEQYLLIEARPAAVPVSAVAAKDRGAVDRLGHDVARFAAACRQRREEWAARLDELHRLGQTVVLWGAGSKAVAFLTTLRGHGAIEYAVDINPYKHGTYLPGGAQAIVAPEALRELRPDVVIVMNPIYRDEVRRSLHDLGLAPRLMTV